jgi:hypothetical protein
VSSSRAFYSATRLGNGEVLIAGGANVNSLAQATTVITSVTPLAGAKLFNPTTLTFTNTGKMTIARSWQPRPYWGMGKCSLLVGYFF